MQTRTYDGMLSIDLGEEPFDVLRLSSLDDALAEELKWIDEKIVTVRYWITDQQCTRDAAQEQFMRRLFGAAEVEFWSHYSELTGYLWTDEGLQVGGHDLLRELRDSAGKWLILEIEWKA